SCGPMELYFGLGDARSASRISITWPSGAKSALEDVPPGVVTVLEGEPGFKHEPYRKRGIPPRSLVPHLLRRGDPFEVALREQGGSAIEPASFRGTTSVVNVWSAGCPSCACEVQD